jgi:uncharacterized LabA/DUF88 family protein
MEFLDLKLNNLGIDKEKFGKIFSFIDYGNVNYWYDKDIRDWEDNLLAKNQKLIVDIEKLASFVSSFSEQKRFYYGWNPRRETNWHIVIKAEKYGFIKNTKPMQFVKHYIGEAVINRDGKSTKKDSKGTYIEIPKSNFDVEISVDAIRILDQYNTFCLFSGDSDFTYLAQFLKKKGKKVIVVASGQVFHTLKESSDLYINAQDIKGQISSIKETSPLLGRGLDIGSRSAGQGSQN